MVNNAQTPLSPVKRDGIIGRLSAIIRTCMIDFELNPRAYPYLSHSLTYAAQCALALQDKEAAGRIYYRMERHIEDKNQNKASNDLFDSSFACLALMLGDFDTVNQNLDYKVSNIDRSYNCEHSMIIAANHPDISVAKRLMQKLESRGSIKEEAVCLAGMIGDRDAIKRLIEELLEETKIRDGCLYGTPFFYWDKVEFVLYHPDLGRRLARAVSKYSDSGCKTQAGVMAGLLDDHETVNSILQLSGRLSSLEKSKIFASLGNAERIEQLLLERIRQSTSRNLYPAHYSGNLLPATYSRELTLLAIRNPEGAEQILRALELEKFPIGVLAAKVLEYIRRGFPGSQRPVQIFAVEQQLSVNERNNIQKVETIHTDEPTEELISGNDQNNAFTGLPLGETGVWPQSASSPQEVTASPGAYAVVIGKDIDTRNLISVGDIERRSGLYILGKPGMGKTTLITNLIYQDIQHGHGVFFLDPHGDAIKELVMSDTRRIGESAIYLDPDQDGWSFGINVLACDNVDSTVSRMDTYTRAMNIFKNLWEASWGPWLELILQYTLLTLVENQGYTLADMPLFLTNRDFRDNLVRNVKHNDRLSFFWRQEFESKRRLLERERQIDPALARIDALLGHTYVQDIVSQPKTTIDFSALIDQRRIIFVKIPARFPDDVKKFIGTIIISELLHAIRKREHIPEAKRQQFCLYVDEFQHFVSDKDLGTAITEARKYGIATTLAHQERYGQLRDNKSVLGATAAAANKVFFQLTVIDAKELAPEVAKAPTTETRYERQLVISQSPFYDLLQGHTNPKIREFVNTYLRRLQDQLGFTGDQKETTRLHRMATLDSVALSRIDERLVGFERSLIASAARSNITAHTGDVLAEVQRLTFELLFLHQKELGIKYTIQRINTFLTEIMEARIKVGQEAFISFLIGRVDNLTSMPDEQRKILKLYVALVYGDPRDPRRIPNIKDLVTVDQDFALKASEIRSIMDRKLGEEKRAEIQKIREGIAHSQWSYASEQFHSYMLRVRYYSPNTENGRFGKYLPYPPLHEMQVKHPKEYEEWLDRPVYYGESLFSEKTQREYNTAQIEKDVANKVAKMFPPVTIVYDDLPPQILSARQIVILKIKCLELLRNHIRNLAAILKVLEDFVELCQLLCVPEN